MHPSEAIHPLLYLSINSPIHSPFYQSIHPSTHWTPSLHLSSDSFTQPFICLLISHTHSINPYMQLSVCPLILIVHMQSLHPSNPPTHPSFYPRICLLTHSFICYLLTVGRTCLLSSTPLPTHPCTPPSTNYLLCFNPSTLSKTKKNDRAFLSLEDLMCSLWGHKTSKCEIITVVLLFTYLFYILERKRITTLGNMWGAHLPIRYQKSNWDWLKPEKGFVDIRWEEASWTTSLGSIQISAGAQWDGSRGEESNSVGQEVCPFLKVFI